MFWHFYKYRTKILLRNKSMLFWTLAFPILLGLMFMAAFGEIDQGGNLETINTGIVIKADQTALSENFTTVLEQVEVNDKPLFEVQELSEVEANEKLNADDLAGFYLIDGSSVSAPCGSSRNESDVDEKRHGSILQRIGIISSKVAEVENVDLAPIMTVLNKKYLFKKFMQVVI